MSKISLLLKQIFALFIPRRCPLCGASLLPNEQDICVECMANLPLTYNWLRANNNSLTKAFEGRIPLKNASALLFFTAGSISQRAVHNFKYYNNPKVAYILGAIYGRELSSCGAFNDVDMLIPVPLHRWRYLSRGYNQSEIFCQGMASQMQGVDVECGAVKRVRFTKKQALSGGRSQRWSNVEDAFRLDKPHKLLGRKIMIVDDVITTGATVEACVRAINERMPQVDVWVGCCAMAGKK